MEPHRLGLVSGRAHHFMTVARLRSIRQAAQVLDVAPSSVSRTIKQLEDDLGTPLFDRTRQKLKLTSAGELLAHRIGEANGELSRAVNEIGALHGLRSGTVTVAVIESAARGLVPEALACFWANLPKICVDVQVTNSQAAVDLVARREAEIAIAIDVPVPRKTRRVAAVDLHLGVLAAPDSALAQRKGPLRSEDLAGERVIQSDSSLSLGPSVERVFAGSFVEFSRRSSTNSIALMLDLARRGLGTVLQTRLGAQAEIARGELIFLPLAEARLGLRRLSVISRPESELSDEAEALARCFADQLEVL